MENRQKKEFEILFQELIESKKDLFLDIMKLVYDEKHNFLFVNIPTQKMYKNFDLIEIKEDSDSDEDEIEIK